MTIWMFFGYRPFYHLDYVLTRKSKTRRLRALLLHARCEFQTEIHQVRSPDVSNAPIFASYSVPFISENLTNTF